MIFERKKTLGVKMANILHFNNTNISIKPQGCKCHQFKPSFARNIKNFTPKYEKKKQPQKPGGIVFKEYNSIRLLFSSTPAKP